ncbi:hypothetical protein [Konateibacter massiliensis]|uniref:hypothetical protein n=1 Tax=Konateibacter massiliensis TaxID=2002841 RepID=UPI000C14D839|nr:hypothetical protein [Konateibacter massiliensis]
MKNRTKEKVEKRKNCKTIQNDDTTVKEKEIQDKKENRRSIRLGTIIAIVAILSTICTILYKMTRNVINIWPESGHLYYIYMWILFLAPLGATVVIFFEIIWFIIGDLKRYNILDEKYEEYDTLSDKRYFRLISDFKFLIEVLVFIILLVIPVSIYLYEAPFKYVYVGAVMVLCIVGIFIFIPQLKKKKIQFGKIIIFFKRIGTWVLTCFLIFTFVILQHKVAHLEVNYESDGIITLINKSDENFVSLKVSVGNSDLVNSFVEDNIDKSELLFAKETKHISAKNDEGNEIGSAQVLSGEILYWKYQYLLNDVKLEPGSYIIVITVQQDNRSIEIMNEFKLSNGIYTFGQNRIEKEY